MAIQTTGLLKLVWLEILSVYCNNPGQPNSTEGGIITEYNYNLSNPGRWISVYIQNITYQEEQSFCFNQWILIKKTRILGTCQSIMKWSYVLLLSFNRNSIEDIFIWWEQEKQK